MATVSKSQTRISQQSASIGSESPLFLPHVGKSRWEQLRHFVPVSRETWRKLHKAGKAPRPERLSLRCTVWDNAQIHKWLANPSTYVVEGAENE